MLYLAPGETSATRDIQPGKWGNPTILYAASRLAALNMTGRRAGTGGLPTKAEISAFTSIRRIQSGLANLFGTRTPPWLHANHVVAYVWSRTGRHGLAWRQWCWANGRSSRPLRPNARPHSCLPPSREGSKYMCCTWLSFCSGDHPVSI